MGTASAARTPGRAGGSRLARLLVGAIIPFLMLLALPSWAAEPGASISDFQHTTWTARDGVLPDTWAIAQTTDGWLWFAGPSGLTRFDGLGFEKVDVGPSDFHLSDGISALYATTSGALLIAHQSGGVSVLDRGRLSQVNNDATKRVGGIHTFAQGADGVIWAAARNGLLRFDGKTWEDVGRDWDYPGGFASGAFADASGTVWVAALKEVFRLRSGSHHFETVHLAVAEWADFVESPDGRLWYVDRLGLHRLPDQDGVRPRGPSVNSRMSYIGLFDHQGTFWSQWLVMNGVPLPASTVRDVLTLGTAKTYLEDREGNVWIGEQNAVVHRMSRHKLARLTQLPDTSDHVPWMSFAVDGAGRVWVAASGGEGQPSVEGLWQIDRGLLRHVQADRIKEASAIAGDADGAIWVGNQEGVWKLEDGRLAKAFDLPAGKSVRLANGLTVNCAGGLWLTAVGFGLLRHDGTAWRSSVDVKGLPPGIPNFQTCDRERRLWLGYGDGTVARIDHDRAVVFSAAQGLQVGAVSAILGGRRTLVAGERGLAVFADGTFRPLKAGMPAFEGVTGIIETNDGDVWLNGVRGLVRIRAAELDRALSSSEADVGIELYDGSDGYPTPGFSAVANGFTSLAQGGDGRIWFAGHGGIASIDPSQAQRSVVPAPLVIRSLSLGGHDHALAPKVRLPASTQNVEIGYAALDYSHPERLRFRYRLEGLDASWIDAVTRRKAFYTNLGPGAYRFVVNVTDENGLWSDRSAALDVVIPPTFVQSRAFEVLCVLALILILTLAYRARVRRLEARQQALLKERLDERERIARELHDTLLQGTQALIFRVHAAASRLPNEEPARAELDEAMRTADDVLAEGRNRIQNLRAKEEPLDDVAAALCLACDELARGGETRSRVLCEGTTRVLAPAVAEASYLIGREALSNAFRHADARSVEVQIIFSDAAFRLQVRDDGVGLNTAVVEAGSTPGHWGLKGMSERAQTIGGRLELWSGIGSGTEIALIVPAASAYREPPARRRWVRFLRSIVGNRLGSPRVIVGPH